MLGGKSVVFHSFSKCTRHFLFSKNETINRLMIRKIHNNMTTIIIIIINHNYNCFMFIGLFLIHTYPNLEMFQHKAVILLNPRVDGVEVQAVHNT